MLERGLVAPGLYGLQEACKVHVDSGRQISVGPVHREDALHVATGRLPRPAATIQAAKTHSAVRARRAHGRTDLQQVEGSRGVAPAGVLPRTAFAQIKSFYTG